MIRARPTATAETVRAIAAASGGGWRRVRVWQYTLRQSSGRRYFHISGGGCAREKSHGDGHNGAAGKPERMSLAHWFAPWMGANRYDSTYPRFGLEYVSTYSIGACGVLHQPQADRSPGAISPGPPRRGAGGGR